MMQKFIGHKIVIIIFSIFFLIPCYSETVIGPFDDSIQPILPNFPPSLIPVASAAYSRECSDASPVYSNDILLLDTNKIDVYRCIRWLNGNFKLQADDNRFHQLGLPYLYYISGDFRLEAKIY